MLVSVTPLPPDSFDTEPMLLIRTGDSLRAVGIEDAAKWSQQLHQSLSDAGKRLGTAIDRQVWELLPGAYKEYVVSIGISPPA